MGRLVLQVKQCETPGVGKETHSHLEVRHQYAETVIYSLEALDENTGRLGRWSENPLRAGTVRPWTMESNNVTWTITDAEFESEWHRKRSEERQAEAERRRLEEESRQREVREREMRERQARIEQEKREQAERKRQEEAEKQREQAERQRREEAEKQQEDARRQQERAEREQRRKQQEQADEDETSDGVAPYVSPETARQRREEARRQEGLSKLEADKRRAEERIATTNNYFDALGGLAGAGMERGLMDGQFVADFAPLSSWAGIRDSAGLNESLTGIALALELDIHLWQSEVSERDEAPTFLVQRVALRFGVFDSAFTATESAAFLGLDEPSISVTSVESELTFLWAQGFYSWGIVGGIQSLAVTRDESEPSNPTRFHIGTRGELSFGNYGYKETFGKLYLQSGWIFDGPEDGQYVRIGLEFSMGLLHLRMEYADFSANDDPLSDLKTELLDYQILIAGGIRAAW